MLRPFEYLDPILGQLRSGLDDDPTMPYKNIVHKVINSKVLLDELPTQLDRVYGVDTANNEMYYEVVDEAPEVNEFSVNYFTGVVTFHPSAEGKSIALTWAGRGGLFFPASRIWTRESNGEVVQTLDDVVKAASDFVHMGVYNPSTQYNKFNLVFYQGSTYIALKDTLGNPPTNEEYWAKVAGFTFRNVYSSSTTYVVGDVVVDSQKRNIYISLTNNNKGNALSNATHWVLMVSVQDVVDSITVLEASIQAAENARVTAESKRVTDENTRNTNENTRKSNETTRQTNETNRQSAESGRVSTENTRVSTENQRISDENVRKANELTREDNEATRQSQEQSRQTAESARVNEENIRVDTENQRITNESTRVSAEDSRVLAESTRDSNESTRVANESSREDSEATRQSNETTRQSQEQSRQTNTTNAIGELNQVKDSWSYKKDGYDNTFAYKVNNVVTYNGNSYICIQNSTGNLPTNTAYWRLFAAKGIDGTGTIRTIASPNNSITIGGTEEDITLEVDQSILDDTNDTLEDIKSKIVEITGENDYEDSPAINLSQANNKIEDIETVVNPVEQSINLGGWKFKPNSNGDLEIFYSGS